MVGVSPGLGIEQVEQSQVVRRRQAGGQGGVIHEDRLRGAPDLHVGCLLDNSLQGSEGGAVDLLAGPVLLRRHDHVRHGRVHEMQGSLVNEGNPVLLGHVCLAVAEPVAHHGHLGLVDLHAGGEVHLRHRVGEALLVPPADGEVPVVRGLGVEGHDHVARLVYRLGVFGARHLQADEGVVRGDPGFDDAQVSPLRALHGAQASPLR
mmetsp:Transcript_105458/g.251179  ORF Transcript_105458/g.251179 Transcript_105458/m.251179 type:complete len:206 (-) Transcript_105458:5022-5639(-)